MRTRTAAAALLVVAASAGAAVATAGVHSGDSWLAPALADGFPVFRTAAAPADRLPARAQAAVARGPQPELGAVPAQSRRAATLADGSGLFLVPARRHLCLAADIGTVFCHDVEAAGRGQLAGVTLLPGNRLRATGAAPDDTVRAVVHLADRRTVVAALGAGAWSADLPPAAEPVLARVEGDGWQTTIGLASPR